MGQKHDLPQWYRRCPQAHRGHAAPMTPSTCTLLPPPCWTFCWCPADPQFSLQVVSHFLVQHLHQFNFLYIWGHSEPDVCSWGTSRPQPDGASLLSLGAPHREEEKSLPRSLDGFPAPIGWFIWNEHVTFFPTAADTLDSDTGIFTAKGEPKPKKCPLHPSCRPRQKTGLGHSPYPTTLDLSRSL